MMAGTFHDHLNECQRCRTQPFNLCADGARLLSEAAVDAADHVCEHGTAMDVHCCNCHSGFIFDRDHECPDPSDGEHPAGYGHGV
jgi:hypothetical protein